MYICNEKCLGRKSSAVERLMTSRPVQHGPHYFDGTSALPKGAERWASYLWATDGLGDVCISPTISSNDPTALNVSPVGTSDFDVIMDVRGTRYQIKGNTFYPGQTSGAKVPFNTSAVAEGKAPIVFIAHGQHATFHNPTRVSAQTNAGTTRTLSLFRV